MMTEKSYNAGICNLCGSHDYRQVHYFKEITQGREVVRDVAVIQCRWCKVRRRMPAIVDDYEQQYHVPYVEQGRSIHPHQLSHFADLMTARLCRFGETSVQFLDVGCSTGRILRLAATMGFEVTGLDYSRWAADFCAGQGFATRQGSLIGQWIEGARFDVIHCSHTIEHVPDPVAYLKEIQRLLKPGGHLMLACPNYASLPRLLLRDRWIWCLDSHLWQFTARQMKRLLRDQGFRIVSARTHHGLTPNNPWKRRLLELGAALGYGDGLNIIATRT